jgi:type VI secretion system ImpC/EvpB family protein
MPERLQFDFSLGKTGKRREESDPMRLLVLGDFSAASTTARVPLAVRPTHRVDIESVDALMQRLRPRVELPSGAFEPTQIDDLHPDRVYARLDIFRELAAKRLQPPAEHDELLGRLLGKASDAPASPRPKGLDALIHDAVAPHIVKDTSARDKAYLEGVDSAIAGQMRSVLHAPPFQALERAWRGLQWLVSGLELDENLQVHVFDATRDELVDDIVASGGQLAQTGLYRALADRWRNVPGGQPWSAIAVLQEFGASDADVGLLAALGLIASQAGGPLLGGADWRLTDDDDKGLSGWNTLRRSEAAPWIGLAAPRVLLRLPYGKRSDPIDAFAFDEFAGAPDQDALLWGHASLATALLIGRAFSASGWEMEPGDEREIGELPAYTFESGGEKQLQPAGEHFLTERGIQKLLDRGLIPLASRRDRNAIVAVRFQSIADPPSAIAW